MDMKAFERHYLLLTKAVGRELADFMGEENVKFVPVDEQLDAARAIAELYAEAQGVPVSSDLIDDCLRSAKGDALEAWWQAEGSDRIRRRRAEMRAYIEERTGRPLLPV
jgi:hypothetical protein